MSSHCTTKLLFNTIFQNQMRSKIRTASIKHVSYSIVQVIERVIENKQAFGGTHAIDYSS